jgi:hypothetical protein
MRVAAWFLRRCIWIGVAGILATSLAGCTGRGGGYLPPAGPLFTGPASFGFDFSCERSSNSTSPNPPAGRLRIELEYTEHAANPIGTGFTIHGTVDTIDPVLESMICIGENPPPTPNELIFLGRYRRTTSAPAGFPTACPTRETTATPLCRFEVIVRDNDGDGGPSMGDAFAIKLSSSSVFDDELDPATVFYTRAGLLQGGNLTVE